MPIAQKFNLSLIAHNGSVLVPGGEDEGKVTVSLYGGEALSPSPTTPMGPGEQGKAWEIFGWASRRVFETEQGGKVVLAPSGMTGNVSGHVECRSDQFQ